MGQQQPAIGHDVSALMPQVGEDVTALMSSHEPDRRPAEHPHARTWRLVRENLPAIGATGAVALTGGTGLLPAVGAALLGGAGGSGLQQIDRAVTGSGPVADSASGVVSEMATEGAKQGAAELVGGGVVRGGRVLARGLMKGAMPKPIKVEYGGNKVADAALDTGAIPGSQRSADRIARLSNEANQQTRNVARGMPPLSRQEITAGFREPFEEASTAKMSETATKIAEHTRNVGRELKGGISAEGAYVRKKILQRQGQAALNNPDTAAFMPQLKDTERATITGLLRRDPAMAESLNQSQAMMGLDDFMKDSLHNNMFTRMGGGPLNMLRSPTALSVAGHAVNQGRKAFSPQALRLLDMILKEGSHQE